MFQTNGVEKFPRSMAIAVNTAITEIEKDGPIPPEAAAQLGMEIFTMLLEDMAISPEEGMPPVVEGITGEQLQEVLPAILVMYSDSHPEVSKEDIQEVMRQVTESVQSQMGMEGNPIAEAAGGAQQSGPSAAPAAPAASGPESIRTASPPSGMLSQAGGPV
jgi:hypothetical protein